MGRNRNRGWSRSRSRVEENRKNKSLALARRRTQRRQPWQTAGNGTIDKCIALWKSKGFDVSCDAPYNPDCPYKILPVKQLIDSGDIYSLVKYTMYKVKYLLCEINAMAKRHGEEYVFREIVKVVSSIKGRIFTIITVNVTELYTCVVKTVEAFIFEDVLIIGRDNYDLREWKFKPGCPEAPFVVCFVDENLLSCPEYSYPDSDSGSDSDSVVDGSYYVCSTPDEIMWRSEIDRIVSERANYYRVN